MLCAKCKKRMAVVFMQRQENGETINEGYCFTCAKDMGIKPVNDLIAQMGISEDDIDAMSEQLVEMGDVDPEEMEEYMPGGNATFPFMNMLGGGQAGENQGKSEQNTKEKGRKKEKKKKFLDAYCTHLTKRARDGELDNIIGRDREIYRVVQILSRRTKNNPCLIGEPGVGKTAIAEGIAQKIAQGEVPAKLADKEVYLLDLTALVAGTQFRGQFESRIKGLVDEVKAEGNIILFIDEVHNLVGTGDSEGSMNAANILKPALSRGEIQVIGATTFNEYRKYIEKDSALERRFQPVTVEEPSIDDAIKVIEGIKHYYEQYHGVKIPKDILASTVTMSEKYITDRFLPDKAIDLMDEACSCAALASEELAEYQGLLKQLTAAEKQQEELESATEIDYEAVAKVKAHIIVVKDRLKELEPVATNIKVTYDDLAKVIELWTGIPASKIKETELEKVANLEDKIKEKIVGQDEAVSQVAKAIKRSRAQLSSIRRPASFIFVGPTGVGKTELVKVLSSELFDSVEPLIRLDMSEFMEKHTVSKLIGAPPGYIGYDEAGQLTEKIRRKPYSVILFDEIEKAHPDIMNILLQILDEGKITDSHGRKVDFSNTIIVMTSNAGSQFQKGALGFHNTQEAMSRENALKGLREFLRPEFISRVDEIIIFKPLNLENYTQIAVMLLDELKEPLKAKDIAFGYTKEVAEEIAKTALSNKYGARDIRREIRRQVEDQIADIVVSNFHNPVTMIQFGLKDGKIAADYN